MGTANVLKAQVKEGKAAVGALSLALPSAMPEGSNVQAIVRPHDVRVSTADAEPSPTGRWAACAASPGWVPT